jgi:transglutaminase-like putative cysteine protease
MRLTVDHRTRYRFSEPQAQVIQLLRMTPLDHAHQTVLDWRIDVDRDARLREGRDGYGNVTTMLYVDGPIEALSVMVRGEVLTDPAEGLLQGAVETLPPLFFTRHTPLTTPGRLVGLLAEGVAPTTEGARELNERVFRAISVAPDRTHKGRTAEDVIAEARGSVRDRAHVLIAAARLAGFPARLVSGHCLDRPNPRSHRSAHCWVELHVGADGWVSFDPSMGRQPGETYVRVAIGLDASDSTPLSGTRRGGGIEELDVDVRVAAAQRQE